MERPIQLFVNVDDGGNIIAAQMGESIVATEEFNFFFLIDMEIANAIHSYKVVLNGMKAALVLKEGGDAA